MGEEIDSSGCRRCGPLAVLCLEQLPVRQGSHSQAPDHRPATVTHLCKSAAGPIFSRMECFEKHRIDLAVNLETATDREFATLPQISARQEDCRSPAKVASPNPPQPRVSIVRRNG